MSKARDLSTREIFLYYVLLVGVVVEQARRCRRPPAGAKYSLAKISHENRTATVTSGLRLNVCVDWPTNGTASQIPIHTLHKAKEVACENVRAAAMSRSFGSDLRQMLKMEGALALAVVWDGHTYTEWVDS